MNQKFTTGGIIVLGVAFWTFAQNAQGDSRKIFNLFLFVLLVSMILLNWQNFSKLLFVQGPQNTPQQPQTPHDASYSIPSGRFSMTN